MEITLRITIPDQIIMEGVQPPTEAEWETLAHSSFTNKISQTESKAKAKVQKPSSEIAKQSEDADREFQNALDTLSSIVAAQRALNSPGIKVHINKG